MSKHRLPRPNHFHFEHLWLLIGSRYLSLEIGL